MNSYQKESIVTGDSDAFHVGLFSFAGTSTHENGTLVAHSRAAAGHPPMTWDVALKTGSLGFICLAAVFANFMVAYTLVRKEQLLVPSNRLVFNLTGSNFVFSLLILPFVIVSTAQEKWLFGIFWCNFTGFFTLLVSIASILTSAMIAIDRYYAIVKPMVYTRTITVAKSTAMLLCVWIQATVFSLPPLFGWSRFDCLTSKATCLVMWKDDIFYSTFLLGFCVFLPFGVMVSCYYFIFQVVRAKCRKINVGTVTSSVAAAAVAGEMVSADHHPKPIHHPPLKYQLRLDNHRPSLPRRKSSLVLLSTYSSLSKGFRTICVVVGAFLVTWIPCVTMAILDIACGSSCVGGAFRVIALWLLYASSVSYPIVYGVYNRSIRKEIVAYLCPPNSKVKKGLPRRNSRRLSFSGSLFDYAPFRSRGTASSVSVRTSFDFGRASIDLGSLPAFRRAAAARRPSQDSGAIMTESDMDTDFSFLPSYWFSRGSVSSRTGFHHLSAKLGFFRRRPSSPTIGSQPFPILQIVDTVATPKPLQTEVQTAVQKEETLNSAVIPETSPLNASTFSPSLHQRLRDIPSLPGDAAEEHRDDAVLDLTRAQDRAGRDEHLFFTRKPPLQSQGASIDEGIVNDCVIQDLE